MGARLFDVTQCLCKSNYCRSQLYAVLYHYQERIDFRWTKGADECLTNARSNRRHLPKCHQRIWIVRLDINGDGCVVVCDEEFRTHCFASVFLLETVFCRQLRDTLSVGSVFLERFRRNLI